MHPAIKALNQLAELTGIRNYDQLSQYCDDETENTKEIYFKDQSENIVTECNESFKTQFENSADLTYCSNWGCIICYSIEKAIDMCCKHNWTAYYMKNGNPLAIN